MKILLVDDDLDFQEIFKSNLTDEKSLVAVSTVASAIKEIEKDKFDLIVIDWMLPMESGKTLIDWIHNNKDDIRGAKVWINTSMPVDRIRKYTNGSRLFNKHIDNVSKAISEEYLNEGGPCQI